MKSKPYFQIGLMIGFVIVGLFLFHRFTLFLVPLFAILYLVLSRMNQKSGLEMEEEDPADWWKQGEKKNWDL